VAGQGALEDAGVVDAGPGHVAGPLPGQPAVVGLEEPRRELERPLGVGEGGGRVAARVEADARPVRVGDGVAPEGDRPVEVRPGGLEVGLAGPGAAAAAPGGALVGSSSIARSKAAAAASGFSWKWQAAPSSTHSVGSNGKRATPRRRSASAAAGSPASRRA